MPFPFLYLAVSLACGILSASLVSASLPFSVIGLLAFLVFAWLAFLLKKHRLCLVLVLAATFFFGLGLYILKDRGYEQNAIRRFAFSDYADFSGWLYRSPGFGIERTYLYLRVEKLAYQNREENVSGNLRITVLHPGQYPSPLRLKVGDKVKVSALVLPVRDYLNFGEPRLANLRKNQDIHNHAVTKSALLVDLRDGKASLPSSRWISSLRLRFQQKIEEHFSSPEGTAMSQAGAVLEALLLGERGRMDEATTLALQKSGLFHLIAISGAHIAIISFLFFSVLRFCRVPKRPAYAVLFLLLLFYAFLVEGRASVFRATIMTLVYLTGKLIWRSVHLLNTISFSAFILLLANPFSLFDMGFELTYAATLSIILFFPAILRFLPSLPLKINDLFALSLTAQLGVLPFLASSFNRVTFASLFLNLLAVPLTGVIMAFGFLFLGVSLVSQLMARLLTQGLILLVGLLLKIAHLFDPVPVLSYHIPTPHLATILGYFLFLGFFLLPFKFKGQKLMTATIFALFLLILISYPFPACSSRALRLTFLDVGQGDSILVEFPGRKKMLIDGGGSPDDRFDVGEHVVSPFLWKKGIKTLDYLVLTHAHPDHLNGLKAVARNFKIIHFWESFSPGSLPAYEELRRSLTSAVIKTRIFRGFSHREGEVLIEALQPEEEAPYEREVSNDASLVLRLSAGTSSFLLASDIGVKAEADIIERAGVIRSEVLKSPHHGSRFSSSAAFLETVRPRLIVITVGRGNLYHMPHPEIIERYRAIGARILRTDEVGAIEISTEGSELTIRTSRQESRGKASQFP
jgi:competence protein ComEC